VLSSPVFAKPHLRPPVLGLAKGVCPCPAPQLIRPDSPPSTLLLRALCELSVKNSSTVHGNRPVPPIITPPNIDNCSPRIAPLRPPLHQTAKSRPLFSTPCALFCNYGGGGGWSDFLSSHFEFRFSIFPISIRINTSRRTPRFTVFWPKSSVRKPFRISTSTMFVCKLFRIRTCRKQEGRGVAVVLSVN
jgi:hypothetical protein